MKDHLQSNDWIQIQETSKALAMHWNWNEEHYQLRYLNPKESIENVISLFI